LREEGNINQIYESSSSNVDRETSKNVEAEVIRIISHLSSFSSSSPFYEKLNKASELNNSLLCVGLDPDLDKIPTKIFGSGPEALFEFNKKIIDLTKDYVLGYKLQSAFYEAHGPKGMEAMKSTADYIPSHLLKIIDAKRGDIENTMEMYAKSLFDFYNFDAATVVPYLGFDSLSPFIKRKDKGTFILCRSSNAGGDEIQTQIIGDNDGIALYEYVALKARDSNKMRNLGLVCGATFPNEVKRVREIVGDGFPILIPGVGAQRGDLELAVKNGIDSKKSNAIISVGRSIIYPSSSKNEENRQQQQGVEQDYFDGSSVERAAKDFCQKIRRIIGRDPE
jgi:orotidine-5'-phosphate decarboxylase